MSTLEDKRLERSHRAKSNFAIFRVGAGIQRRSLGSLLGALVSVSVVVASVVAGCSATEQQDPTGASEATGTTELALSSAIQGNIATTFRKTLVRVGTCDAYGNGCTTQATWTPVTSNTCAATPRADGMVTGSVSGPADCQALGNQLLDAFKKQSPGAGQVTVTAVASTAAQCSICDGPSCCYTAGNSTTYGGGTITKCVGAEASTTCTSTPCCAITGNAYGGSPTAACKKVGESFDLNDISFCQVKLVVTPCDPLTSCSNQCKNLSTDSGFCGSCTNKCRSDETCSAAKCSCPSGLNDCNGACRNYLSDNNNCGSCGHTCSGGQTCSGGVCVCPSGVECNNACRNFSSDHDNCGSCGHACGGDQDCVSGACICKSRCGNVCMDFNTDSHNCGGCGNVCSAGNTCCNGRCVDLSRDALNCGTCGSACRYATNSGAQVITSTCSLQSTCSGGSCEPLNFFSYCRNCPGGYFTEISNILASSQDEAYQCAWRTGTNCSFTQGRCSF